MLPHTHSRGRRGSDGGGEQHQPAALPEPGGAAGASAAAGPLDEGLLSSLQGALALVNSVELGAQQAQQAQLPMQQPHLPMQRAQQAPLPMQRAQQTQPPMQQAQQGAPLAQQAAPQQQWEPGPPELWQGPPLIEGQQQAQQQALQQWHSLPPTRPPAPQGQQRALQEWHSLSPRYMQQPEPQPPLYTQPAPQQQPPGRAWSAAAPPPAAAHGASLPPGGSAPMLPAPMPAVCSLVVKGLPGNVTDAQLAAFFRWVLWVLPHQQLWGGARAAGEAGSGRVTQCHHLARLLLPPPCSPHAPLPLNPQVALPLFRDGPSDKRGQRDGAVFQRCPAGPGACRGGCRMLRQLVSGTACWGGWLDRKAPILFQQTTPEFALLLGSFVVSVTDHISNLNCPPHVGPCPAAAEWLPLPWHQLRAACACS